MLQPIDLTGESQRTESPMAEPTRIVGHAATATDAPLDEFPDPEEDDLDDLDDMLDEFTAPKSTGQAPETPLPSSGAGKLPHTIPKDVLPTGGVSDDDFAKQLQAGMADLMQELETSPEMQTQFQTLLQELGGDAAAQVGAQAGSHSPQDCFGARDAKDKTSDATQAQGLLSGRLPGKEVDFQETINKTMERMQASGEQATAAAASDQEGDFLAEMMKAMATGGAGGESGGDEDFSKMILGMMEQLTNKEILYEPMKELNDKFPEWMAKNATSTKDEDLKRYREQQIYVKEIVDRFERSTYKDENAPDREFIVDRMQKMQAAGSPPADLVGDMAAAQEAFGAPEEGCATQ